MVKIKICGLKRLEDIEILNKYKPDYIGFVFADSKRKVTHDLADKMKKKLDSSIESVGGVLVATYQSKDASGNVIVYIKAKVQKIGEKLELQYPQRSGNEIQACIQKYQQ